MEVPDMVAYAVSLVCPADLTWFPGADTSGFCLPLAGPRDENEAMASVAVVAPTEMTVEAESPGDPAVLHDGPLLPSAITGTIPALTQALRTVLNQV